MKEYETPDELLEFVLTKCGDMKYKYSEYYVNDKDPNSLFFRELNIKKVSILKEYIMQIS